MSEVKTVTRVPLWLAVAITVIVSLPFGLFLGDYNIALWASFVVWAEYFALGGKPEGFKYILLTYPVGALFMAIFAVVNNYSVINLRWSERQCFCSRMAVRPGCSCSVCNEIP